MCLSHALIIFPVDMPSGHRDFLRSPVETNFVVDKLFITEEV